MNFNNVSFDVYRRWFNRRFKLSLDGKFVGLLRLGSMLQLFAHKLHKLLHRSSRQRPLGDVLVMSINHHVIKLYSF